MIANTIGFLGIKQYELHREGFKNGKQSFNFGEVWGTPTEALLSSTDRNFTVFRSSSTSAILDISCFLVLLMRLFFRGIHHRLPPRINR